MKPTARTPVPPAAAAVATAVDMAMMRLALEHARRAATLGEVPVGAVVYRGDQVLAAAHNLRESASDPTAHAEILALRAAAHALSSWRLDGCGLAVTLEPCPMCAGALVNARIQRLVYGPADPKMGCVHTLHQLCTEPRFNHQVIVIPGVLEDECAAELKAFFKQRRRADKPAKPSPRPPG